MMKQTEDFSDPQVITESCSLFLKEACINAQTLHAYTQKLRKYQDMKVDIEKRSLPFDSCPNVKAKLDSELQELQKATLNTRQTIQDLETRVIETISQSFYSASEVSSNIQVPNPAQITTKFDFKAYEPQIETQKELIKQLFDSKLDASESKILYDLIGDTDKSIRDDIQESTTRLEDEISTQSAKVEAFVQEQQNNSSQSHIEHLAENISRQMIGLPSIEEEKKSMNNLALQWLTQRTFHDYLGKLFLQQINGKPLYSNEPLSIRDNSIKVRKHNRQRNKINSSLKKIAQMDREAKHFLDLFAKNLGSNSVQHLIENLDRIDQVTKNHQEVLDFMNAPMGVTSTDGQDAPNSIENNIPNYLNIYTRNSNLSGALATSLAQYTDRYYFSDLRDRVDALEKKINDL